MRNQLKKDLSSVEKYLADSDYYAMRAQLNRYIYKPDEYAELQQKINSKFKPYLDKKLLLETQIKNMSGKNLFKSNANELTK